MVTLTEQQAERIEAAVRQAEAGTSSEITVGIVPASGDDRGMAAIAGAMIVAVIFTVGPMIWWNLERWLWAVIALAAGLVAFWLCDHFDLGLRCLPARLLLRDARRAARAMFLDHRLDDTPERNAVLLFVSRAERYVEVLPDRAAAAAIDPARWTAIVDEFRERMPKSDLGEAVAGAVAAIGRLCAGRFPAPSAKPDRIPNRPLQS